MPLYCYETYVGVGYDNDAATWITIILLTSDVDRKSIKLIFQLI